MGIVLLALGGSRTKESGRGLVKILGSTGVSRSARVELVSRAGAFLTGAGFVFV